MTVRRHIRRLLSIWLALLSFVACGGVAPTATLAPAAADVAGERARMVLVLWHAWPYPEDHTLAALVERYNRSQPSVQIVLQAHSVATITSDLALGVAEGGGPHMAILQSHVLGSLAEDGVLLPLNSLLAASDLGAIIPAALGSAQIVTPGGSSLYGAPITFDALALYYNKANFAAVPPDDTIALLAVARGLTDTDSDPPTWGLALNLSLDRTIGYLYAFGGRVFDDQGELVLGLDGRDGAEEWLAWLEDLHSDERILASTDGIAVDNALMNREALMTFDWAHAMGSYRDLWQENMGVAPLPRLSDGDRPPQPYVQSDALVLSARIGAPERQAAVDFIRYMLGADAQADLLRAGRQPTLRSLDLASVEGLDAPLREAARVFRGQAAQSLPMPNSREANEVMWGALSDMHANVLRRLIDPAQAVSDADSAMRARLGLPPAP